jgi:hypothetical protein
MLLIVSVALPVLVTVTVWAVLVVPTVTLPKVRLLGAVLTAGSGAGGVMFPPALPPQEVITNTAAMSNNAKRNRLMVVLLLAAS